MNIPVRWVLIGCVSHFSLVYSLPVGLTQLRVMTFNTWHAGKETQDGVNNIVKHIRNVKPDIVGLQECERNALAVILQRLGTEWSACENTREERIVIITRLPIRQKLGLLATSDPMVAACQIEVNSDPVKLINVWNVHLYWGYYGPYAACIHNVRDPYQLYLSDYAGDKLHGVVNRDKKSGRLTEILNLFRHSPFWNSVVAANTEPSMLLMGDFNSPSHLDWVESSKHTHCNWTFQWPITRLLFDYGFRDSYRDVHPDPHLFPGNTWSPIYKYMSDWDGIYIDEPQDRIDFILYKGKDLKPVRSQEYFGNATLTWMPYHQTNDWPSDHAAVVTEFELFYG